MENNFGPNLIYLKHFGSWSWQKDLRQVYHACSDFCKKAYSSIHMDQIELFAIENGILDKVIVIKTQII